MADQISNSTKLEVTRTSRGFAVAMGVDLYAEPYSIQDSSLAEEAAIWLGRDADTGGRAHLTQDMAAGLIPLLQAFVATGSIAGSADTIAAPPAMDREAVERVREAAYRQALEDVCNPLGYLQRMADAEGAKLSGMAYAIASDIGTIQRIAKEALSTLSADAIRHGEGEASNRVIYLLQGDNSRMAAALRSCRDQFAFYAREHTVAGKSEKAATNARFAKIADDALTAIKPATPASHASGAAATTKES